MKRSKSGRILALALACAILALLFCACEGSDEPSTDYVYFKNDTGCKVTGFYISTPDEEEWGSKLNWGDYVSAGAKIHIDVEKLVNGAGLYDVGAIDENALNYEVYEVPLAPGDTIALSAEGEECVCVVTHIDGTAQTYTGYAYYEDDAG